MPFGPRGGGGQRGGNTKKSRRAVSPTGPYPAESSNKKIRAKASPSERRALSRDKGPTGKRVRQLAREDRALAPAAKPTPRPGKPPRTRPVPTRQSVPPRQEKRIVRRVKRLETKRSRGPLPGLGPAESKVARKVLNTGRRMGATRKEALAATETGLVESGFRNLGYGDADSEGWRQERGAYYSNPRNVKAAARRFFSESVSDTGGTRGAGMTAGQLAQTIQASANPAAYDERKPEAAAILGAYNKGGLKPGERRQLKGLKTRAKRLGIQLPKSQVGQVPKKVMTRFKAGLAAAKELEKAKLPYVWGGGHGDPQAKPTGGGLDCSGAVSYVLNKMGVMKGTLVSGDMGSVLESGPGAVTVFYNPVHTFMRIGNRYFGTSSTNPGGGAGFIEGKPDDLSKYSVGHVPGMGKKVAVAMGLSVNGGFPGMALSASDTTATITAGATQGAPGFSSKPITPMQRSRRTLRKLKKLGVGVQPTQETPEDELKNLHELERKYDRGAV